MSPELAANAPIGEARDPNRVAWLALATFGVYGLVWFYKFGREIDAAGDFGIRPTRWYKQLAILAGVIITLPVALIHFFVYASHVAKATQELARRSKETQVDVEGYYPLLLIPFAGVVYLAMLQKAGNRIWARLKERHKERGKELEAARKRKPTPVEQLIQCPVCSQVVVVRYTPGRTATARCNACGFTAPYEGPGPSG